MSTEQEAFIPMTHSDLSVFILYSFVITNQCSVMYYITSLIAGRLCNVYKTCGLVSEGVHSVTRLSDDLCILLFLVK